MQVLTTKKNQKIINNLNNNNNNLVIISLIIPLPVGMNNEKLYIYIYLIYPKKNLLLL